MSEITDRVVCIIPAFNEEATVASIARLTRAHPLVQKVIVVDDGSSDRTAERAREVNGVEVLKLTPNRGKGAAMKAGIDASNEEVILFLDADLLGMTEDHVSDLLAPVLAGEADMSVGLFRGGRLHTDMAHVITPSLSGQRAVRREVVASLDMEALGFGIERALTELWETGSIRVTEVILHGVTHRTKEEKRGFFKGVGQRLKMYVDILHFEAGRLARRLAGRKE
jgi:glycosyltransferase involved in cell wall biosynthesis